MSLCKIDLFFFFSRSYHHYWFDKARVNVIIVKSTRIKLLLFFESSPSEAITSGFKKKKGKTSHCLFNSNGMLITVHSWVNAKIHIVYSLNIIPESHNWQFFLKIIAYYENNAFILFFKIKTSGNIKPINRKEKEWQYSPEKYYKQLKEIKAQ